MKKTARIQLDWSRLLGFDQAPTGAQGDASSIRDPRLAKVGQKVGVKPGVKPEP